jgi:hypothetical protein
MELAKELANIQEYFNRFKFNISVHEFLASFKEVNNPFINNFRNIVFEFTINNLYYFDNYVLSLSSSQFFL